MASEGQELGKGVFGYRRSAVNQIIADRDIMLRQAEGRVRAAESKVAELEGELGSLRERNSRMEEQLERLRSQLDVVVQYQGPAPSVAAVQTGSPAMAEPVPADGGEAFNPDVFAPSSEAPSVEAAELAGTTLPAGGSDDDVLFENWDTPYSDQDESPVPQYEISDAGGLYDIPSVDEEPETSVPPLFDGADGFDVPPPHPEPQVEAEPAFSFEAHESSFGTSDPAHRDQPAEETTDQTEPEHTQREEDLVAALQESPMEFGQETPFETDAPQGDVMTPGDEEHPTGSPGWSSADDSLFVDREDDQPAVPGAEEAATPEAHAPATVAEPEPDRTAEMTSRFLSDEIGGILTAAEESAARIVDRARESTEQQVAEADRLWREVQAEVARFAAWRQQVEPMVQAVQAKVNEVRSQVEDVPERIRQALAPMADAISSIDADLAELASVGNPPLLLTPSGFEGGESEYPGSDADPEPRSWFPGNAGESSESGGFYGSDAPDEHERHGPDDSGMGANAG